MKYSIIVPVYNAEKTLQRCIDSVLAQSFTDYELILVNDGSSDGSAAICSVNSAKYSCIKYICKDNGGVSSARNLGIESAAGEYILFLDSDDYISDNYFNVLNGIYSNSSPDLVIFGAQAVGGADQKWQTGDYFYNTQDGIAIRIAQAMQEYNFSSVCNKAFKRTIISSRGIVFDGRLAIGEDQIFLFEYAMNIASIKSVNDIIYNFDTSDKGSLSRKYREYLLDQLITVDRRMYSAYRSSSHKSRHYESALSWAFYRSAYSCFNELTKIDLTNKQRLAEINRICTAFNADRIEPIGLKCKMIALPVRLRMSRIIDLIVRIKSKIFG